MPIARCEKRGCRSKNPKAVWMINGKRYCHTCGESVIETQGVDSLRIYRLSDRDCDFIDSGPAPAQVARA